MRSLFALVCLLTITLASQAGHSCPFCTSQGQTLSSEIGQADFIVLGKLKNPKRDPDGISGTTEMEIETTVKSHEFLTGKKTLLLPRYITVDARDKDARYMVFCNLYNPPSDLALSAVVSTVVLTDHRRVTLDPYRGDQIKADSKLPAYLKGAIIAREKDTPTRLKYFFDYLDASELAISSDAMMEFGNADYADVRKLSANVPAAKLVAWLKDPNTPISRYGLYGMMLGLSGKESDSKMLRELLDHPENAYSSGFDGLLAGYILLNKKEGWDYMMGILGDTKRDFSIRYSTLKVLRFFWNDHPNYIPKDQLLTAVKSMVKQDDLADLPIEDLRKWGVWEETPYVMSFLQLQSHKKQLIKRSILRFAISASTDGKNAAAKAYVDQMRTEDPERVKFAEEMLQDEKPKK